MVLAYIFYIVVSIAVVTFLLGPKDPRKARITKKKSELTAAWEERLKKFGEWDKSIESQKEYHARRNQMSAEHQAAMKAAESEPELESDKPPQWALSPTQCVYGGAILGILAVVGMSWLGGKYGSGNSLFPKEQKNIRPFVGYSNKPPPPQPGLVWVDGYLRKDGTFVEGYWRTQADGDPRNNLNPREPSYSKPRR